MIKQNPRWILVGDLIMFFVPVRSLDLTVLYAVGNNILTPLFLTGFSVRAGKTEARKNPDFSPECFSTFPVGSEDPTGTGTCVNL